jgi:hypothetical protein
MRRMMTAMTSAGVLALATGLAAAAPAGQKNNNNSNSSPPPAATEIQGNNPMINSKSTGNTNANGNGNVPANSRAEAARAGGNANATTGAAPRGGAQQERGPNFIGSGAQFRDNHP